MLTKTRTTAQAINQITMEMEKYQKKVGNPGTQILLSVLYRKTNETRAIKKLIVRIQNSETDDESVCLSIQEAINIANPVLIKAMGIVAIMYIINSFAASGSELRQLKYIIANKNTQNVEHEAITASLEFLNLLFMSVVKLLPPISY